MPHNRDPNLPPLTTWQVESLRLTAFPDPAVEITDPSWWTDLVGEPPGTRTVQPRKRSKQEEGPFGGGKLTLTIQPIRIDWLFTPLDDQLQEVYGFPTIGTFPESLSVFVPLMLHWFDFETCPSLKRLAFGAILLQPVDDHEAGYRQISSYLPYVRLDPEGSANFSYQINRRRNSSSGIANLRINRLTKWSVATRVGVGLSLGSTTTEILQRLRQFACRLELDINTVSEFQGELAREQLPRVFQELVEFGKEIAREGDIP